MRGKLNKVSVYVYAYDAKLREKIPGKPEVGSALTQGTVADKREGRRQDLDQTV